LAFISYASEDREAVDALAEELEARGIRVWEDHQNLRAGDNWNEVLLDVIKRKADYVIVVQTPAMTTAIRGVFRREIEVAKALQTEMGEFDGQRLHFLVPIKIGDCELLSSLKEFHVIEVDVSVSNSLDLLANSILGDWENRAKLKPRSGGSS